jgi:hypothetical protein
MEANLYIVKIGLGQAAAGVKQNLYSVKITSDVEK